MSNVKFAALVLALASSCRAPVVARQPDDANVRALAAELALAETTKPSPTVRVSEGASPRRVEASPPIRKYSAATFELVARISRGTESSDERRLVTRSDDRVHIVEHGGAEEWLFVRNPLDPARFEGVRVLHRQRQIVEYPMIELQMAGLAANWDAIASLGFAPELLAGAEPTGKTQEGFGLEFRNFSAGKSDGPELWWNEELALPYAAILPRFDGKTLVTLANLRLDADAAQLVEPVIRFPNYAVSDVSDWREALHDH